MAIRNVGGHGVTTVAGGPNSHNTHALGAQPTFRDAPQVNNMNDSAATVAARPKKKSAVPPVLTTRRRSANSYPGEAGRI